MRLNSKELKVVVDEIFNRVSFPIVQENEKLMESIIIEDEYTKDYQTVTELQNKINELQDVIYNLNKKWIDKSTIGLTGYQRENLLKRYISVERSKDPRIKKYPSHSEIEAKIIISGYSEIPELIDQICSMYNK